MTLFYCFHAEFRAKPYLEVDAARVACGVGAPADQRLRHTFLYFQIEQVCECYTVGTKVIILLSQAYAHGASSA